ncbi:MAG: porin family protein [Rikenellaceae bacterium]
MKRLIMLIVCLAIVGGASAKGTPNSDNFSFGVKAGLNVSGMLMESYNPKTKAGFHIGLVSEYKFTDRFAIAPELLYSSQGFSSKDGDYKLRMKSNYLNIPLLARFYIIDALSVELGPQLGFNLGMKEKTIIYGDSGSEKIEKSDYNLFEFAIGLGATYNYKMFFASARYNIGLTNVIKEEKNKNSVFQFSVGCKF